MLACVAIGHVGISPAGREILKEEDVMPLIPSSTFGVAEVVDVSSEFSKGRHYGFSKHFYAP
jgi:hypothetical protein